LRFGNGSENFDNRGREAADNGSLTDNPYRSRLTTIVKKHRKIFLRLLILAVLLVSSGCASHSSLRDLRRSYLPTRLG